MLKPAALATIVFALSPTPAAAAKVAKGPWIAVEQDTASPIEVTKPEGVEVDSEVTRRRYEMALLVPIPARVLGGMFLLKGDFYKEQREYEPKASGPTENDARNPNVAGAGAVFLPHAQEGAPRFLVVIERYGNMSFKDDAKPMSEYIIGADISDDALPFKLKIGDTDETESRVLVRLRRFPGFNKWLLLVGHRIDRKNGFSLDIAIPSHLLAGWETPDGAWKFYGGGRATSREYPVYNVTGAGWVEGSALYGLAGVRRKLIGPAFAALEGGVTREDLVLHDEKGKEIVVQNTKFKPFVRLALETWVTTPGPGGATEK